jgi:G3E family GTPase
MAPTKRHAAKSAESFRKLPVTLLSGFLGSGKTTLLQHILRNKSGLRCAVLLNDNVELNVDAKMLQNLKVVRADEKLVQFDNGCICCTLREVPCTPGVLAWVILTRCASEQDLLIEVKKLAKMQKFDYLIIESTGISEPMQVAETFTFDDESGKVLSEFSTLDTCVTVIDAVNFQRHFFSVSTSGAVDVR